MLFSLLFLYHFNTSAQLQCTVKLHIMQKLNQTYANARQQQRMSLGFNVAKSCSCSHFLLLFFLPPTVYIYSQMFFLSFPWQVPVPIPNEQNFEKTHMFFSSLLRSFYAVFAYFVHWICLCIYCFALTLDTVIRICKQMNLAYGILWMIFMRSHNRLPFELYYSLNACTHACMNDIIWTIASGKIN